ncbi:hypothetical protein [Pedobacter sp. V48]|uniref:hypothetical protein n=1 Tax=Pedobacter sp. V48 TaxID=509635 RepID=UPI0003E4E402|nr:hypothetical protein [Pedobacter sp. V48]ETZ21907.1 hypothetical protein N824_25760 [Pedobacter sp. V48]
MSAYRRRDFLKLSSLSALPLIMPINTFAVEKPRPSIDSEAVYFINDGIFYRPEDFLNKLQEINTANPIERDNYAEGGTIERLCILDILGKWK